MALKKKKDSDVIYTPTGKDQVLPVVPDLMKGGKKTGGSTLVDFLKSSPGEYNPIYDINAGGDKTKTTKQVGNPGDLAGAQTTDAYYPGQYLSPVKMDKLTNSYWGTMPVFTGGQTLYPAGIEDARRQAIVSSLAYQQQKQSTDLNKLESQFALPLGKAAYQPMINDKYFKDISGSFEDMYGRLGRGKMLQIAADPMNPDWGEDGKQYMGMLGKYAQLNQLAAATNKIDENVKNIYTKIADGKSVLLPEQEKLLDGIEKGYMTDDKGNKVPITEEQILEMPSMMKTYQTIAEKDVQLKDFIGKKVESYYENGIPVKQKDGSTKIVTSANGEEFFNAIQKTVTDDDTIDGWVKLYGQDMSLDPYYRQNPDILKDHIKTIFPNEYKQTMEKVSAMPEWMSGAAAKNKPDTWFLQYLNDIDNNTVQGQEVNLSQSGPSGKGTGTFYPFNADWTDQQQKITQERWVDSQGKDVPPNTPGALKQSTSSDASIKVKGFVKSKDGGLYKITDADITNEGTYLLKPENLIKNKWTDAYVPYTKFKHGATGDQVVDNTLKFINKNYPDYSRKVGAPNELSEPPKHPLPTGKPQSVIQGGHTYTWNPATGQYE